MIQERNFIKLHNRMYVDINVSDIAAYIIILLCYLFTISVKYIYSNNYWKELSQSFMLNDFSENRWKFNFGFKLKEEILKDFLIGSTISWCNLEWGLPYHYVWINNNCCKMHLFQFNEYFTHMVFVYNHLVTPQFPLCFWSAGNGSKWLNATTILLNKKHNYSQVNYSC